MSLPTSWRTTALLAAKVLVSVAMLWFLFHRLHWERIGPALGHADGRWIAAAAGLLILSNLLASYQWGRLLGAVDIRLPFWKVAAYYHVGLFFNNFLPANVGGDLARTLDASRQLKDSTTGVDVRITYAAGKLTVRPASGASALYNMSLRYDAEYGEPVDRKSVV